MKIPSRADDVVDARGQPVAFPDRPEVEDAERESGRCARIDSTVSRNSGKSLRSAPLAITSRPPLVVNAAGTKSISFPT